MKMIKYLLVLTLVIPGIANASFGSPSASPTGSNSSGRFTATTLDQSASTTEKKAVLSDTEITKSILTKLIHEEPDIAVSARHLKISTVSGRVTLTGKVRNEKQKDKVGTIAESVVGTSLVDNQLVFK